MSDDLPPRDDPAPCRRPRRGREIRMVAPLADDDADDAEGGDPVCWAHLVCDECGAITTEGHRDGCARSR